MIKLMEVYVCMLLYLERSEVVFDEGDEVKWDEASVFGDDDDESELWKMTMLCSMMVVMEVWKSYGLYVGLKLFVYGEDGVVWWTMVCREFEKSLSYVVTVL